MVGSPGFMSPEQVRGERATAAADVFSLGCVLAYAATGRLPFGAADASTHALLLRATQEEPDTTGLHAGLALLVRDCLREDPAARPTTQEVIARAGETGTRPWLPGGLLAELEQHTVRLTGGTPAARPSAPGAVADAGPATARLRPVAPEQPVPGGAVARGALDGGAAAGDDGGLASAGAAGAAFPDPSAQEQTARIPQVVPPQPPTHPQPPYLPKALTVPAPTPQYTPPPAASLPQTAPPDRHAPQPQVPQPTGRPGPQAAPPHGAEGSAQQASASGQAPGQTGYGYPLQAPAEQPAPSQAPGYGYPQYAASGVGVVRQDGGYGPPAGAYRTGDGGVLPPAPFAAAFVPDPDHGDGRSESPARGRRGTYALIAVAVVVALGAGGAVYSFMGSGGSKTGADQAPAPATAPNSPDESSSSQPPGPFAIVLSARGGCRARRLRGDLARRREHERGLRSPAARDQAGQGGGRGPGPDGGRPSG